MKQARVMQGEDACRQVGIRRSAGIGRPVDVRRPADVRRLGGLVLALVATALAGLAFAASPASAQTYTDVPKVHWAHAAVDWVTDVGPLGRKVLDDYGAKFRPERAITRRQLARALVIASGHQDDTVTPVAIPDVVPDIDPYYWDIQIAVSLGLMAASGDGFHPDATVTASKAESAIVRMIKLMQSDDDWGLLTALRPGTWEPTAGWRPTVPSRLPYVVASRHLLLRFNHPYGNEEQEVLPGEAIDRAEVAYMLREALTLSEWEVDGLVAYKSISLPALSKRQRQVLGFALKYVGYPYVYCGEYPTRDSPYGYQECGGFDCSGFVWWVLKIHFKYPISVNERGASDMARKAKPRVSRSGLKPGDIMFFGPNGPRSTAGSIYHAAIYMGRGWFIHSTGSSDGVTVASLNASDYWRTHFAWGRRVLTKAELALQ
ncbi:MAG TPA: NlpC/P60 family protein [Thermoleophilia bacterium]|nr:NlpC/P60 family protein [Thermoleophilia bacterium]